VNLAAQVRKELAARALIAGEREACGVITNGDSGLVVLESANLHPRPDLAFMIDPVLMRQVGSRVVAIWHTHPDDSPPSERDQSVCDWFGVPHVVYVAGLARVFQLEPRPRWRALVGRPWRWGVYDCWSLVREYHDLVLGIWVPDLKRPKEHDVEAWRERLLTLVGVEFVPVAEGQEQPGDVLGIHLVEPGIDHLAVCLGDQILHHPLDGVSSVDDLTPGWRRRVVGAWRHRRRVRS